MDDKPKPEPVDRRGGERSKVAFRASVSARDGTMPLECLVRDATHHGCRIVSSAINELPDDIMLTIDGVSKPIDGRIVWRRAKQAGVEFCLEDPGEVLQRPIACGSRQTPSLADLSRGPGPDTSGS